jgi:DNA-binding response OmpR family regulator
MVKPFGTRELMARIRAVLVADVGGCLARWFTFPNDRFRAAHREAEGRRA